MLEPKVINSEDAYRGNLEDQKKDILSNFRFEQVAMIMASPCLPIYKNEEDDKPEIIGYEPWKILTKYGLRVPNIYDLYRCAEGLLDEVIKEVYKDPKSNYHGIASGPFKVTYLYGNLTLDFVVESWGNY
nr:MAG TPA: hypothetical protein [Crassvirales sp.]